MGLLSNEFFDIIKIIQKNGYNSVCMLGRQSVHISVEEFANISRKYGYKFNIETDLDEMKNKPVLDSVALFKMIGICDVHCMDCSDYEGADLIFNLNSTELPSEYVGRYDLVINGGTLEHVFNIANAMNNINKLVSVGGTIIHISPCSGWIDHGFYSISPTFFLDYYYLNRNMFEIEKIYVEIITKGELVLSKDCREVIDINKYLDRFSSDRTLLICTVKRKRDCKVSDEFPIQGRYVQTYSKKTKKPHINFECLRTELEKNVCAIYGMGYWGKEVLKYIINKELGSQLLCIYDTDLEKIEKKICGYDIRYPNSKIINNTATIILAVQNDTREIEKMLEALNYKGQLVKVINY